MDDHADAALVDWLRSTGQVRFWNAGVPIARQGTRADCVSLIRSGLVKVVSRTSSGRQILLGVRRSGDVLGEFSALDGRPRSADLLAVTDVSGWAVPSAQFVAHVATSPGVATALLRVLVRRLREADLRRLEFGSLDTTSRVAAVLGSSNGEQGTDTWIPLTQSELAEAVGASREATVKALARLRRAEIVETRRGRVRVLRPGVLADVAEHSDVLPPYRSSS